MATASEQRAIHASHEAGMHDKKPKPETCKSCARELREQEATQVAKEKTVCFCGGSYDGTPSGRAKHDSTAKHAAYIAANSAEFSGPVDRPVVEELAPEPTVATPELTGRAAVIRADLAALRDTISRERDRRVVDHKWRVANRPSEAGAYFESKVAPLLSQIDTLSDAIRLIEDLAD